MTLVRHKDKKSGRVYVYESTPHYDPISKQQRPKRKYLGVEDPVTGEIIPSAGKRGRKLGVKNVKKTQPAAASEHQDTDKTIELSSRLRALEQELKNCREERDGLRRDLGSARKLLAQIARIANGHEAR